MLTDLPYKKFSEKFSEKFGEVFGEKISEKFSGKFGEKFSEKIGEKISEKIVENFGPKCSCSPHRHWGVHLVGDARGSAWPVLAKNVECRAGSGS